MNHQYWCSHSHDACGQSSSALRAIERAQQFLFLCELGAALLEQHGLAALHVHHAAHAAMTFAKIEWYSGESAAEQHEQKEQGC